MLSFATEFPVRASHTSTNFLEAMATWISGSPHTSFSPKILRELHERDKVLLKIDNEKVESLTTSTPGIELAGIRYSKHDKGLDWLTSVVFSKTSSDAWVGIRVECESERASARLPNAKKPVVVRTLLNSLGGATDGSLSIRDSAHILGNNDVELAAQLIHGDTDCRLPIVYVSSPFNGKALSLDVNRLAADLSGMAHVVVEPNRSFSVRLQIEVESKNVYGGTVGIYWPQGGGRRAFFLGGEYSSPGKLARAIKHEIQTALLNRRPSTRCTWANIQETASKQTIQSLKDSGSKEVENFVSAFDQEIKAKQQLLDNAEKEIQRLQNEIRKLEAQSGAANGSLLNPGSEQDLYPNEVLGILIDVIKDAASRVPQDSRREHVLTSLLKSNQLGNPPFSSYQEQLKKLLRGMTTIDKKIQQGLEQMGFSISGDGKHFKLVFQGDDRYTYTLPKSGSDRRAGLNAASDISRLLF